MAVVLGAVVVGLVLLAAAWAILRVGPRFARLSAVPPAAPAAEEATAFDPARQLALRAAQAQAEVRSLYLGDHTALCRILGRHKLFVDTRDLALAPHLMWDGFWELWITEAMSRCLEAGMVVVDVGANFGYYTVLMADAVGPGGRVFAFEPNAAIARLLQASGSINGFRDRITVDTRAAWSATGERLEFFIPGDHPMNASLSIRADEPGALVEVETVRLDDALPERVDFVKIDAEGAEREVWRGLRRTLEANDRIQVFLEFNATRLGPESEPFLDEIEDLGFKLAQVDVDSTVKGMSRSEILSQGVDDVMLCLTRGW